MFELTRQRLRRSIGTISHTDREIVEVCENELDAAEKRIKELEARIDRLTYIGKKDDGYEY